MYFVRRFLTAQYFNNKMCWATLWTVCSNNQGNGCVSFSSDVVRRLPLTRQSWWMHPSRVVVQYPDFRGLLLPKIFVHQPIRKESTVKWRKQSFRLRSPQNALWLMKLWDYILRKLYTFNIKGKVGIYWFYFPGSHDFDFVWTQKLTLWEETKVKIHKA